MLDSHIAPASAYLRTARVIVRDGGIELTPIATGTLHGYVYELPFNGYLTLQVFLTPTADFELVVLQELEVKGHSVRPTTSNSMSGATPRRIHPRVSIDHPDSSSPADVVVTFDLTFVDVTSAVMSAGLLETELQEFGDAPGPFNGPGEFSPGDLFHGCALHILEMTLGEPKAWAVLIPPVVKDDTTRDAFNIVQFFGPTSTPAGVAANFVLSESREEKHFPEKFSIYRSALDVDSDEAKSPYGVAYLARYTRDPAKFRPFVFPTTLKADDKGDSRAASSLNWGGFAGQLAASKKPVLFVLPFPHGDVRRAKRATALGLGEVLNSLLVALYAGGTIGSEAAAQAPTLTGLALAGFNDGAIPAFQAFTNNAADVDEVYCLGPTIDPPLQELAKWFKKNRRHKVRMVSGGALAPQSMKAARSAIIKGTHARESDVTFTPDSDDFFDTPENTYHAALCFADSPMWLVEASGSKPPAGLTVDTNISFKDMTPGHVTIEAKTTPAPSVRTLDQDRTRVEVSGLIQSVWLGDKSQRFVKTQADFDHLLQIFDASHHPEFTSRALRDQWPIIGGVGNVKRFPYGEQPSPPDRKFFEGYLHFCLKQSEFE